MKKTGLFVLLLATAGWAQSIPQERTPDKTVPDLA